MSPSADESQSNAGPPTELLAELQRKFQENPRRYFAPLASEYRKAGDIDRAIELCRAHLPHQPGHLSGYVVYAQALFDAGRLIESSAVFQEALRLDAENIVALRYSGDIARARGEREEALRFYQQALVFDPADEELVTYIAELQEPDLMESTWEQDFADISEPFPEYHSEPEQRSVQPEPVNFQEELADVSANSSETVLSLDDELADELPEPSEPVTPVASPFVTETMAELYLQQGFAQEALQVYRQLAALRDEPRFHEKVRLLEGKDTQYPTLDNGDSIVAFSAAEDVGVDQPAAEAAESRESVRAFFARLAARATGDDSALPNQVA